MKKILVSILFLFVLTSCGLSKEASLTPQETGNTANTENSVETKETQTQVTTSIIPLASVVNTIGGEHVNVNNIIPAGVSPHGFDMSAKDMVALKNTDLVFMVGLEHIDGFLEKAAEGKSQVHLANGMELLAGTPHEHHDDHEDHHDHEDEHEHHEETEHTDAHNDEHTHDSHEHHDDHKDEDHHDEHEHNHDKDPHVWLGKENIITIAGKIRDELATVMPEHADYFSANLQNFESDLNALYEDFAKKHEGKTPTEFIVFHDAYNYLLESASIPQDIKMPFSENVLHETSVAHMKELTDEIEKHGIKTLYKEPQFNVKALEELAWKYNLDILTLDPLGKNENAGGYIENIKNNLDSLGAIYE